MPITTSFAVCACGSCVPLGIPLPLRTLYRSDTSPEQPTLPGPLAPRAANLLPAPPGAPLLQALGALQAWLSPAARVCPHSPFPSYLLSPLSLNFLRVFRTLAHDRAYWVRGPGGPYPDLYLPLTFSFSNSRPRLPSPGPPGPIILLHSRALSIAALSPAPMGE